MLTFFHEPFFRGKISSRKHAEQDPRAIVAPAPGAPAVVAVVPRGALLGGDAALLREDGDARLGAAVAAVVQELEDLAGPAHHAGHARVHAPAAPPRRGVDAEGAVGGPIQPLRQLRRVPDLPATQSDWFG